MAIKAVFIYYIYKKWGTERGLLGGWRGIVRRSPTQRIKIILIRLDRCSLRSGPLKSPTLPYLFNYFTIKAPTSLVILKDFSAFFLNEIYFKIFKNKQVSRGYS